MGGTGNRWRLWDQFSVRGAGFPADGVLRLAPDGLAAAADGFADVRSFTGAGWKAFEESFDAAAEKCALQMQEIAGDQAFQAAVGWQNRAVLGRAVRPFLDWLPGSGRTSRTRQREELISHYWQRFCVKNDTIGFFGPVGWGRVDPTAPGLVVEPGDGLIAETEVYFASWAVDGLARAITADPAFTPWIAPRRVPFVRVAGRLVSLPGCKAREVTADLVDVLERCDGTRSAAAIGEELGRDVTAELTELVRRRYVVWRLDIPADAHPERHLRTWLEGVGDPHARQRGLDRLEVLTGGRDRVRAAGGADELVAAMSALEHDFEALTDSAGAREKGAAPGRALVYSDSRRAAAVRLGPDVLSAMAPLDPLLTSAAWLTSELAERVVRRAREVFAAQSGPVDLATFWFACMPILHRDAPADAEALRQELWRRWGSVLRLHDGERDVRLSLADIAPRAAEAFGSSGGGWPAARYLSPDLMIAAAGEEAVRRGDFALVLGELHVAMNTLGASLYVNQHPNPAELFDLTSRDHPGPRLVPLQAKEHRARLSTRVRQSLTRPEDYRVALVDDAGDPGTVRSADVVVELRDDRLVAVLPDGAVFDVVDVFSHVLTTLVVDDFRILPKADHTPRVTVDRVVVARETWRFGVDELGFADEKTEARRFVRARGWRARHDLPRFAFVTSPAEPRPVFVDFDSPAYVNLLAKAARRLARADAGARLTVTEMLPTPEQTWLTDDQGNSYTSELRFVLFDTADATDPV